MRQVIIRGMIQQIIVTIIVDFYLCINIYIFIFILAPRARAWASAYHSLFFLSSDLLECVGAAGAGAGGATPGPVALVFNSCVTQLASSSSIIAAESLDSGPGS